MNRKEKKEQMNVCALEFLTIMANGGSIDKAKCDLAKKYKVDKETINEWFRKTGIQLINNKYHLEQKAKDTTNYFKKELNLWQKSNKS